MRPALRGRVRSGSGLGPGPGLGSYTSRVSKLGRQAGRGEGIAPGLSLDL